MEAQAEALLEDVDRLYHCVVANVQVGLALESQALQASQVSVVMDRSARRAFGGLQEMGLAFHCSK